MCIVVDVSVDAQFMCTLVLYSFHILSFFCKKCMLLNALKYKY